MMGGMGWPSGETRGTCRQCDWGQLVGEAEVGCIDETAGPDRSRPQKTSKDHQVDPSPHLASPPSIRAGRTMACG